MSDDKAPNPEPITSEEFDLLSLRLDNIRAMLGVITLDEMATIRATQLASEVALAVTVAILQQHVAQIRAALSVSEMLIAEWPQRTAVLRGVQVNI